MMKKTVVAIDFGSFKIACAAAEKTDQGVRIAAYREVPSEGINRGEIVNIQKVLDRTRPILSEISAEVECDINEVVAGISGQTVKTLSATNKRTRKNTADLISQSEINDLTDDMQKFRVNSSETVLHVIPQYYNIDDLMGETDPIGIQGTEIEGIYKLLIGRSKASENLKTTVSKLGLKLNRMILKPLASAQALLTEDESELGTALVDIGGGTTEIMIIKDKIIRHAAIIPFGGNSVTEDIRQAFGISLKNAEKLKTRFGSCFSDNVSDTKMIAIKNSAGRGDKKISMKALSLVIEARMVEIFEAVLYEITKYTGKENLAAGIVITGGTAEMLHLTTLAKAVTGMPVRVASPDINIAPGSCNEAYTRSASTVVGLAIMAAEQQDEKEEEEEPVANNPAIGIIEEEPAKKIKEDKPKKKINFKSLLGNLFDAADDEA